MHCIHALLGTDVAASHGLNHLDASKGPSEHVKKKEHISVVADRHKPSLRIRVQLSFGQRAH